MSMMLISQAGSCMQCGLHGMHLTSTDGQLKPDPSGSSVHDVGSLLVDLLHLPAVLLKALTAPALCHRNHQRLQHSPLVLFVCSWTQAGPVTCQCAALKLR